MKHHRKKRKYFPRNLLYITIDVLTILPFFEIYLLIRRTSGYAVTEDARYYARLQTLPRFYRVIFVFGTLRNTVGLNQLLIVCVYLIIRIVFLTLFISTSLLYPAEVGKSKEIHDNKKTWNAFGFEPKTPSEMFLLIYITTGNLMLNISHGILFCFICLTKM